HPLKHVVAVELAGDSAGAFRVWPIADLNRECGNLDAAVLPAEKTGGGRRIVVRQRRLDEGRWGERKPELALRAGTWVDRSRLALRIHVPAEAVVDKLLEGHLALDGETCSAAARGIVPLNARVLPTGRLAGEVNGFGVVLRVRARQVALGELLAWVAHPAGAGSGPALDEARPHR